MMRARIPEYAPADKAKKTPGPYFAQANSLTYIAQKKGNMQN